MHHTRRHSHFTSQDARLQLYLHLKLRTQILPLKYRVRNLISSFLNADAEKREASEKLRWVSGIDIFTQSGNSSGVFHVPA